MKLKNNIQKMSCFYASDWHLTVMLLPYINSKINENNQIYMKCENSIEEKMKMLLNKLDIKNKGNILNINWNGSAVQEDDDNTKNKIYIVSGNNEYIESTNKAINQFYETKESNVKIINCYEVAEDEDLNKIIKENGYTQLLNTKGESNINISK